MRFEHDSVVLDGASTITRDYIIYDGFQPYQFSSPRDELMAARETAWLGTYLTMPLVPRVDVWGPDVVEFFNRICVNRDFAKLKIGGSRHALLCNEKGQILHSGVVTKVREDYLRTYALNPSIVFYLETFGKDLAIEYSVTDEYFFQIDGPKSLETLEAACQQDLHELKFAQNTTVMIQGSEVLVHRLGMSGALAYEMHGAPENAETVFRAIRDAGEEFGVRRLGSRNYCNNHTSGGYPNQFIHFAYPWNASGKELADFIGFPALPLSGSAADDEQSYYVTPYDVNWGTLVNFDHEFIGKEALQKVAENPPRTTVTLEWNPSDLAEIYAAEISGEISAHENIDDYREDLAEFRRVHADKVLVDGTPIGIASGRGHDYFSEKFISLAFIDKEYAVEGQEVRVLWGKPGTQQRQIRARVARFPYFNEPYRNETYDVIANVPRKFAAK